MLGFEPAQVVMAEQDVNVRSGSLVPIGIRRHGLCHGERNLHFRQRARLPSHRIVDWRLLHKQ